MAALDGPTEESAQRDPSPIGGDFTLAGGNLIKTIDH
jgi:hypothetical protein